MFPVERGRRAVDSTEVKRQLGFQAVDRFVRDGMRIGLGTGSTAIWAARRLGGLAAEGRLSGVKAVATSLQTELECRSLGIPVLSLNDRAIGGALDLTIDGADEVDPHRCLIKGGGGALLLEKVVAYASERLLIIVEDSKLSARPGEKSAVPVEFVAAALSTVTHALEALGATVSLRIGVRKAGPVVTDLGNLLLDASFPRSYDPQAMEREIKSIPGVLENGIFSRKRPELMVGSASGGIEYRP
jgi:ribose 5-phosphate isomerase A